MACLDKCFYVLQTLFNKIASLRAATLLKRDSNTAIGSFTLSTQYIKYYFSECDNFAEKMFNRYKPTHTKLLSQYRRGCQNHSKIISIKKNTGTVTNCNPTVAYLF